MSQLDQKNTHPWAWSDETIVKLMDELEKVKALIKDNPNDATLGAKVRSWHHDLLEKE